MSKHARRIQGPPDLDAPTTASTMKEGLHYISTTNDLGVRREAVIPADEDVLASRLLGMSILEARLDEGAAGGAVETPASPVA